MNKFLLGVIAGLLIAPKSGKELRKDVCDRAQDFLEDIKDIDARDGFDSFKEKVGSMNADTARDAIVKAGTVTKDVLGDAVEAIQTNEALKAFPRKSVDAVSEAALKTVDYIEQQDLVNKTKEMTKKTVEVTQEAAQKVAEQAEQVKDKTVKKTKETAQKVADQVEELKDKTVEKVKEKFEKK